MKKHLIAAAVAAAVAFPAMAQVTISGTIDASPLQRLKTTTLDEFGAATFSEDTKSDQTATGSGSGGWATSELVFQAVEDIGSGLKATGRVVQQLYQDGSASNGFGNREFSLALSGGFGQVKFGKFGTAAEGAWGRYAVGGTTSAPGTSDSSGYDLIAGTLGYSGRFGGINRQDGVAQYVSPTFSNFKFTVELIDNNTKTEAGTTATEESIGAVVDYSQGPLNLTVAHTKREAGGTRANTVAADSDAVLIVNAAAGTSFSNTGSTTLLVDSEVTTVGAGYDLGGVKLSLAHGLRKDDLKQFEQGGVNVSGIISDIKVTALGLSIPMGAVTLGASMYNGEDSRSANFTADNLDLSGHQIWANYSMSKRTFAYLVFGQNKKELSAPDDATVALNREVKVTGVALGLVHRF